jgi:hypothetical protein
MRMSCGANLNWWIHFRHSSLKPPPETTSALELNKDNLTSSFQSGSSKAQEANVAPIVDGVLLERIEREPRRDVMDSFLAQLAEAENIQESPPEEHSVHDFKAT